MQSEVRQLGQVAYWPTFEAMQAFTAFRTAKKTDFEDGKESEINKYSRDQLWICEHPPVYTQGLAGKASHVLNPGNIPVVQTDRGGQVTYHGPGQVVAYPLIDLRRAGYFVKEYVYRIEEAVLKTLAHFGVTGHRVAGAPGIYVRLDDPFSHAALPTISVRAEPFDPSTSSGQAKLRTGPVEVGTNPFDKLRANGIELGKIAALGIKVSRHCTYHGVALNVAMDLEPFSRINPCGYAGLASTDLSTIGVSVSWQDAADVLGQKLVTYLAP